MTSNMDTSQLLREGLCSKQKYIPVWYRYDKQGSIFNDKCLSDNSYYYFYRCEVDVLKQHIQDVVSQVPDDCVLVEMGSGNSEKSRLFIDTLLTRQSTLEYYPVDISAEFLEETCQALTKDYGDKLRVTPIAGDYSVGINKTSSIPGNKLIIWLGGGFQNQPYKVQVERVESLARVMSEKDRLVIALDVTQSADQVEHAYLDPTGISANLYLNAIWRLNREHGSNIDTNKFQLEAKFERSCDADVLSKVKLRAHSLVQQSYDIPGLGITVSFDAGEYLNLYEGEGVSCKYNEDQLRTMVERGGQRLDRMWVDNESHVAICCVAK